MGWSSGAWSSSDWSGWSSGAWRSSGNSSSAWSSGGSSTGYAYVPPQPKSRPAAPRDREARQGPYQKKIEFLQWWERDDATADVPDDVPEDEDWSYVGSYVDHEEQPEDIEIEIAPPPKPLLSIGLLRYYGYNHFHWFERKYLKFLHENLTDHWPDLQRGHSPETMDRLALIFKVLELDRKAKVDFMLLYHTGIVGRTCANKILWQLLSTWATDGRYRDLSNKVSKEVKHMRQNFERPPKGHRDFKTWSWKHLEENHPHMVKWSPLSVPKNTVGVLVGEGGLPLRPPACWIQE